LQAVDGDEQNGGRRKRPYAARDVRAEEQVHEAEEDDELLELDAAPAVDVAVAVHVVGLLVGHLDLELAQAAPQLVVVDRAVGILVCDGEKPLIILSTRHLRVATEEGEYV
jgi:hypothetical protein